MRDIIPDMLIIFDLDGTLLNTLDDLTDAVNYALWEYGFAPHSVDECRTLVGNGVTKLIERALPEKARTSENIARLRELFFNYYNDHLWDKTRPYAGIGGILGALQTRGVKLAVASNKYQAATERLIAHFFPQITFAAVLGQRENVPIKPHPQIVQDILAAAHETSAHTVYVGDSDVDMQTAQNAGVKACAVTWGFRPRDVLAVYKPAYIIDNPYQLVDI